jgi:hypothetical protein
MELLARRVRKYQGDCHSVIKSHIIAGQT